MAAIRKIIQIDEELCDGCGECVPSCAEGALRVINGKARLVSDVLCDGLGACLGECPTGALTVIERPAEDFDEAVVARRASAAPSVAAHAPAPSDHAGACPSSRVQMFPGRPEAPAAGATGAGPTGPGLFSGRHPAGIIPMSDRTASARPTPSAAPASSSRLRQWPVQLHLVPPTAPFFDHRDVLLAADCVPVAVGDFHTSMLDGRSLAIACPKLDQHLDVYVNKLRAMIDEGGITSLTVAIMEVPCCGGLLRLARQAMAAAQRQVPLHVVTVGIRGNIVDQG